MEAFPTDQPWFMQVNLTGPHGPMDVTERMQARWRGVAFPSAHGNDQFDDATHTAIRQNYAAMIETIDRHLGSYQSAIAARGELDNTIIVYSSDHGEMLGDRQGYQKHYPYEGSAHIPYLVRGPGFAPGSQSTCPVNTWDVTATILDAAGIDVPAEHPLAGDSLLGEADLPEDRIVHFHHGNGRSRYVAGIGCGHKFVHFYNGGEEELFDMAADPWEQHNLLAKGDAPEIATKLRAATLAFEAEQGQGERVKDGEFVDFPYAAPGRHMASFYPPWSYRQYPPWTVGYAAEDRAAILAEMRDSLQDETAYICQEPEWRADAIATWEKLGGKGEELEAIFAAVDAKQ